MFFFQFFPVKMSEKGLLKKKIFQKKALYGKKKFFLEDFRKKRFGINKHRRKEFVGSEKKKKLYRKQCEVPETRITRNHS